MNINNLEQMILTIQQTALQGGDNKLPRELTYQQAFSILLRSWELAEEGSGITRKEKAKQVKTCWRQREEQLRAENQ